MAQAVFGSPLKVLEGETKILSTTAGYVAVNPNFHEVKLYCASAWRLALSPKLLHVLYYTAAAGTYTEYTTNVTDRVAATHLPLNSMLATDYVYMGFSEPVRGAYFDLDGTNFNNVAATLDVEYCSSAVAQGVTIAFTDVAGDSDGTDVAGVTLKQDGVYTWTLPTPWKRSTLGLYNAPLYSNCWWIRFNPSATLSANVDVIEIIPVYQNIAYAYMEAGGEYQFSLNTAEVGGFVVLSIAATPTLNISWVRH